MRARTLLIQLCLAAATITITFALPIELDAQAVRLSLARYTPPAAHSGSSYGKPPS
ncbi:hypothetical protein [Leptolyngbya sp. FACHB-261]|uniref:hypothetical protein n=1 Tax=Leptolyngbya sp. FACHB-261 TaxID=2692806 RepID=UPI001681C858|nr:hypothetical protein [Leptolyngbya sp. FACHB-261]MBD2103302.1 hypothetical protein [Leptolyngbya sp. FACHB-261]